MKPLYTFRTKNFLLVLDAEEEPDPDLSWDDSGEARAKLDTGEWQVFCAKVSIAYRGSEIAVDYLGNCIYANPAGFRDHVGAKGQYGSYFRDMVRECIRQVRKHFKDAPTLRGNAT